MTTKEFFDLRLSTTLEYYSIIQGDDLFRLDNVDKNNNIACYKLGVLTFSVFSFGLVAITIFYINYKF